MRDVVRLRKREKHELKLESECLLRFPKVEQHPKCTDDAILQGIARPGEVILISGAGLSHSAQTFMTNQIARFNAVII